MVYWQQNIFGLVAQEIIECVSKIVSSRYYSMMIVDLTLQDNLLIMNGTDSLPSGKSFEIWKTSLIHNFFNENISHELCEGHSTILTFRCPFFVHFISAVWLT